MKIYKISKFELYRSLCLHGPTLIAIFVLLTTGCAKTADLSTEDQDTNQPSDPSVDPTDPNSPEPEPDPNSDPNGGGTKEKSLCRTIPEEYFEVKSYLSELRDPETSKIICDWKTLGETDDITAMKYFTCTSSPVEEGTSNKATSTYYYYENDSLFFSDINFQKTDRLVTSTTAPNQDESEPNVVTTTTQQSVYDFSSGKLLSYMLYKDIKDDELDPTEASATITEHDVNLQPKSIKQTQTTNGSTCTKNIDYSYNGQKLISKIVESYTGPCEYTNGTTITTSFEYNDLNLIDRSLSQTTLFNKQDPNNPIISSYIRRNYFYSKTSEVCQGD